MRKIYVVLVLLVGLFAGANAQTSGIYESYAIFSINGAANTYYDLSASTANTDFQGANLGTFAKGTNTLIMRGGQNKTFKNGGCNIASSSISYRVYLTGTAPGVFTTINEPFAFDIGGAGDQQWEQAGNPTELISALAPGKYTIQTYVSAEYNSCGGGTHFVNNGGANYTATFTVCGPVSGPLPVGNYPIPGCFPTVAAAAAYINANGITGSGAVQFDVIAGHIETAIVGGIIITATGTATNTIIFKKDGAGVNPTITAFNPQASGQFYDGIIKLIGADYVTFDGFTLQENPLNTTILSGTNNMTEWGIALLQGSATNGSQNNTIQNCTISLNKTYSNTYGVYSSVRHAPTTPATGSDISNATTAPNKNNKFYSNNISNVNMGIVFIGSGVAANQDTGNDIGGNLTTTGNVITNWGTSGAANPPTSMSGTVFCIFVSNQVGENVSYNTITSSAISAPSATRAIFKEYGTSPSLTGTSNINNNTITLTNSTSATSFEVIRSQSSASSSISININNNTLLNCATTAVSASNTIVGISNGSTASTLNINNNIIRGTASTATSGGFTGISNSGAVITAINIDGNQIGNATGGAISYSAATSGATKGIENTGGGAACALSIQTNNIRGIVNSVAATGAQTYIANTAATLSQNISFNTFTNLSIRTSGAVSFINDGVNLLATGSKNINSNSIVTAFVNAGSGSLTLYLDNSSSVNGSTINNNNNNFSNITSSGSATGWQNYDGGSPTKNVNGNTFNNWNLGTSSVNVLNVNFMGGTTSSVSNNTITNINTTGSINGLTLGNTNVATTLTVTNNTINNLISSSVVNGLVSSSPSTASTTTNITSNQINTLSTSGNNALRGIYLTNAGPNTNVTSNVISGLINSSVASLASVVGIEGTAAASAAVNISSNSISTLSTSSTNIGGGNNAAVIGILNNSVVAGNMIANNTIHTLSATNTGTSPVTVVAIATASIASGGTIVKNKFYGSTNTSAGSTFPFIVGFYPNGGSWTFANNMINIDNGANANGMQCAGVYDGGAAGARKYWYNSINIGGTPTVGAQVSVGFQFNAGAGTADIKNNIFNITRSGGTGKNYAIANLGASFTGIASNNNILNAPASTIGIISGAVDKDFANWKLSSGGDDFSYTAVSVPFINPAIADLHINTVSIGTTPTVIESNGVLVAITDDIDAQTRPFAVNTNGGSTTKPDIGADEVDLVPRDLLPPSITYTNLVSTCDVANITLAGVTITDFTGVPTSGTLMPRIYYKKGAGAWFSKPGVLTVGSATNGTWSFTIVNSDMGGVSGGDIISYYIVAQDAATVPNIGSNPSIGFVALDVNNVGTAPTTPNTYTISSSNAGTASATTTSLCVSGTTTISSIGYGSGNGITYQWESSLDNFATAGIGIGSASATYTNYTTPTISVTTYYRLKVTCTPTASVGYSNVLTITVNTPSFSGATGAARCGTGTVNLVATAGSGTLKWYAAASGGVSLGSGTPFTTPSISTTTTFYVAAETASSPGTGTVGAGAGTATVYDNPFYSLYSNLHNQVLIKASELSAAGLVAGNITGLRLTVNSGTTLLPDFSLAIAPYANSNANLTTLQAAGIFTTVYTNAVGYAPSVGNNTITFSTPFNWDGASHIIVKTCWGNSGSTATVASSVAADVPGYICNVAARNTVATSGATICASTTLFSSYNNRPKFTFNGQTTCSSPRTAVVATVNDIPTAITVSPAAPVAVCSNAAAQLLTATGGKTILTNSGQIGTGTLAVGASSYPNPLSSFYGGVKHQLLFTVAELTTLGMVANSNITKIGLDLAAINATGLCNDFTIRIGSTAVSALTGFVAGTTTSYNGSFTPTVIGPVNFTLTTPYVWNGTSNIIVEFVHNQGLTGTGSGTTTKYTTTAGNTVYYGAKDNVTPAGVTSYDAVVTYAVGAFGASNLRPNVIFGYTTQSQKPITWTPIAGLYSDAAATTPYVLNANSATVYAKPAATATYTATATNVTCTAINTALITITPLPTATISYTGSPFCSNGSNPTPTLVGTTGGVYSISGGLTINPTTGEVTLAGAGTGTYTVTYTVAASGGCAAIAPITTINITAAPSATISYTGSPFCSTGSNPSPTLVGTTGGIYTIDGGLTINPTTGEVTLLGAGTGTYTITYTVSAAGGCVAITPTATINITAAPTATISYGVTAYCATGSAAVTLTGTTGGVYSAPGGLVINASSGLVDLATSTPGTYTVTYTVSGAGCAPIASTAFITINPAGSWTGATNTNWSTTTNWCGNTLPTSATNVVIPAGLTNYPEIGTGISALSANITIAAGATVTVSGTGVLNLYGTITNAGILDLTDGKLNVLSAVTLSGTQFKNKTIKDVVASSSFAISATANDTLKVTGLVSFVGNGNVITTNGNLTLVSTATGTASIGDLTNGASNNTGNAVTGAVNIERYIQAVRAWRFLSTPIVSGSTQTIKQAYMENGSALTSTGYGTQITGPATGVDAVVGADVVSIGTSMKYYNPATNSFVSIGSVDNTIERPAGYFVFVRGDRGTNNGSASIPTTLRMKGDIKSGDVSFDNQLSGLPTNAFIPIGNPYPSAVDMRGVNKTGDFTGSVESYTVWNPNAAGVYGVGKYDQYIRLIPGSGNFELVGSGGTIVRNYLESGQAIFMQSSATVPVLSAINFKEKDKSNNAVTILNRGGEEAGRAGVLDPTLEINLYAKDANGSIYKADATLQKFADNNSNIVDKNDVRKVSNNADNLFIVNGTQRLIFERRKTLVDNDTIFLNLTSTRVAPYKFVIDPSVLGNTGLKAILKDKFLQSETPVSLTDSTTIDFNITADAASRVADRFMIVFKQVATTQFTTIAAVRNADKTVTVSWGVQNERDITNYTIEQSNDGINFTTLATKAATANNGTNLSYTTLDATASKAANWYRVKANSTSAAKYTSIAMVAALPADPIVTPMISVFPNPVTDGKLVIKFAAKQGDYTASLVNALGQTMHTASLKISSMVEVKTIPLAANVVAGKYSLILVDSNGNKQSIGVLVK
jgi:Ig-like domain CHU_C associated